MWWWGFDFGQIFGGFNRKEIEARIATPRDGGRAAARRSRRAAGQDRTLESELAMRDGAQTALSKQAAELQNENSQLKEELVFLQKLVADSNKQVGLSIQRLAVERVRDDCSRYSMLVVRGGNPKDEFDGNVALQVTVQPAAAGGGLARPIVLSLPDDQPDRGAAEAQIQVLSAG